MGAVMASVRIIRRCARSWIWGKGENAPDHAEIHRLQDPKLMQDLYADGLRFPRRNHRGQQHRQRLERDGFIDKLYSKRSFPDRSRAVA
jgi:hypothetical protein